MRPIPIWMDCDTGTDDAVALMLAHKLPEVALLGISTVCGNTTQDNAFWNTHRINGLMGTNYPVYRGAEQPLLKPLFTAAHIHGQNGLGDVELPIPEGATVSKEAAWDAMYACAKAHPGALRLISTGPLTNVATAFIKYPDLPGLLHSLNIMGGSAGPGNDTAAAEYNVFTDPHAAEYVFHSGVKLVMCGLDVTTKAFFTMEQLDALAASGTKAGWFTKACNMRAWKILSRFGLNVFCMHDSCPVMYVAHPELFEGEMAGVVVETRGTVTNGKTVTDLYSDKQFPFKNALVLLKVDRERFIEILTDCILSIG